MVTVAATTTPYIIAKSVAPTLSDEAVVQNGEVHEVGAVADLADPSYRCVDER